MEKLCIFCGEKPESKNLEHIVPQWLIELTGDPKRKARFGLQHLGNGQYQERVFSFNAFKFPACESCNQEFSELENKTKPIVQKILSEASISSEEFNLLLNWFDKVRVGLWLGYRYLDKDPFGITPHYYVEKRIGAHDRMLCILKTEEATTGLNFVGCDTLSFTFTPSCFLLRINQYLFLNISYHLLFARRIGFPYIPELFASDDKMGGYWVKGRERIMRPILKKRIILQGTELYQPMFAGVIGLMDSSSLKELFDTKYVRENCYSWEKGIGKIFIKSGDKIKTYTANPTKEWVPQKSYDSECSILESQILVLEWQKYLDDLPINFSLLPKEKRALAIKDKELCKKYNNDLIEHLRKKAKEYGIPPIYL